MNILSPSGDVVFKPWEGPQRRFWDFRGRYGLYGGSGYTGKTQLLMWYPWQQVEEESERIRVGEQDESQGWCLYLRRETKMLREVQARCKRAYPARMEDIDKCWKAMDRTFLLPIGYRITFDHMENDDDWQKYQGYQFTLICWDELTTFTQEQFEMMDSWLRAPAGCKLEPIHRAGSNPVGIGRTWVKQKFKTGKATKDTWGKELTTTSVVEVEGEDGARKKETVKRSQIFIPARVWDNKSVDQAAYIATFDDKSESVKQAMLYGNWDAAVGDLIGQVWDETIHVCKPYKLGALNSRFRACFFSYAYTMVLWFDADRDTNLVCYRDLHLKNHTAKMVAYRIRELEIEAAEWDKTERLDEGSSRITGVLGPAEAWAKTGQRGPAPAETFNRVGLRFHRADDNLQAAVDQIRDRLISRAKDPASKKLTLPALRFFDTCSAALETIPSVPADKANPDLPDPKSESSSYLALCYASASRPIAAQKSTPEDEELGWTKPRARRTGVMQGMRIR